MGYLSGTDQYVSDWDSFSPVPWFFDEYFVEPYNKMAEVCKFRKFAHKKSKAASRKRLATIVYENAALLGGSKRTDKDVLMKRFFEHWIMAMEYLQENHQEDSDGVDILGQRMCITLSVWQFLRPDIRNVVHLSGLRVGKEDAINELSKDKKRRESKRQALQKLRAHYEEFEKRCAYLLKDAEQIKMVEPALIKALAQVEDEVEFLANETQV